MYVFVYYYCIMWIEWPMMNERRCILLMAFWMQRDTVTRSWGPLLRHSSQTITSCCSMIKEHSRVATVHSSWKLKTSKFLHGHHTNRTCHPLRIDGMLWIGVYDSLFQYPAFPHSHWRGVDQHSTGHNQHPDKLCVKEMCCTAWGKWWSHQILTGFRTPNSQHFRVAFCGQPKAHLCNNHAV